MNNSLYQRIEIAFWDFAIRTMSENRNVRTLVQTCSRIIHHKDFNKELLRTVRLLAASAVAGLACGLLVCAVIGFVR